MDHARSGRKPGFAATPFRSRYSSVNVGARNDNPEPARSSSDSLFAGRHDAVTAGLTPVLEPTRSTRRAG